MKVEQQAAYILHIRAFKDSSALLDCLTINEGLVTLVAKGAKRPKSRLFPYMQPFLRLQVSWTGRSELKTLTQIDADSVYPKLQGVKIVLGLYLNELLMRLLQHHDPHPQLFEDYHVVMSALSLTDNKHEQQFRLRQFEIQLLSALGYGLVFCDAKTGETILPELLYSYDPQLGLYEASHLQSQDQTIVSGASIIALQNKTIPTEHELKEAKILMRTILSFHLGAKPLHSRKLYAPVNSI